MYIDIYIYIYTYICKYISDNIQTCACDRVASLTCNRPLIAVALSRLTQQSGRDWGGLTDYTSQEHLDHTKEKRWYMPRMSVSVSGTCYWVFGRSLHPHWSWSLMFFSMCCPAECVDHIPARDLHTDIASRYLQFCFVNSWSIAKWRFYSLVPLSPG